MAHVVTCFVRERGRILLTRRSDAVGTYRGRWAGVSGYVEGDPANAETDAARELREEVGLADADLELVRAGDPLAVDDEEGSFTVHPFLFEAATRAVTPNEELAAVEWADPTQIRTRETVPRLWATWRRVAPTVADVRDDRTHGSAWIAARALEVLRDAAAEAETWDAVAATARDLRAARPEMAAVANRLNRVVAETAQANDGQAPDPTAVVERAIDALGAAFEADADAAATAAARLRDADATTVATLSRSGTVRTAIADSAPETVVVAESRPECEGVGVAEWAAAETDASVTLTTEAALPTALAARDVDAVLVGADAVFPDGAVVNKTGTRVLARAARDAGVPAYVVAARDKIHPTRTVESSDDRSQAGSDDCTSPRAPAVSSPPDAVYGGDADLDVFAPTFEVVPGGFVEGIATEAGLLDAADVAAVAARHAEHAATAARYVS
ncbi:NUDIX domain-containing protein [Halobellus sp. Atlit-31R]|nr:NUDIX domain-containing protein [Halobellus sp. Atlit-31R]